MTELEQRIESLSEAVAKLGFISNSCPCHDAGLKLLLEDIGHELLQLHHFLEYHIEQGQIHWQGGK